MPLPADAELLDLAIQVAHRAADLLVGRAGLPRTDVTAKSSPTDLVSEVDRDAEALIVDALLGARPDDQVVAEEGGVRPGTSGVRWIVDPLDGTTNYLYGLPAWAVSIAAEVGGEVRVGVVVDASRGETFTATRGGGAQLDGRTLRCAAGDDLALALVGTGFAYNASRRAAQGRVAGALLPQVRDLRRVGAAALDLCWVGCGRLDAFYEDGLQEWDLAAGGLVAAEAGATVSGLGRAEPGHPYVVAAGPVVHAQLHDVLMDLVLFPTP